MRQFKTPVMLILASAIMVSIYSCGNRNADPEEGTPKPQTPVTITRVSDSSLADSIQLNATSTYLQKNYVSSNVIGYIQVANVQPGRYVHKGQLLFTIKTKEAQSIGNTINILDTTFRFSGISKIHASSSGFVTQLLHQVGDYVQDGERLAVISEGESFAFVLQLPYELRTAISDNRNILLTLPDGEKLNGHIFSIQPSVDSLSQTQGVLIKVAATHPIPENLIAKALLIKKAVAHAVSLPKSAVLSNEVQDEFWVMKLINDTTAIRTPVKIGLQAGGRVQILSPGFSPTDRIVLTGNYGLADTAWIKIVKP
jgi:multidrug efflux pump subunit AcrA (membrane-fusion protein)